MAMRKASFIMMHRGVGAEPGVDPRREGAFLNFGHIRQQCSIDVVDYSATRSASTRMENADFVQFLKNGHLGRRDPWVKVRWINIGGVSWDVMSSLALKYGTSILAFPVLSLH